ncbi:tRNA (adenosine(37)-N6)-threonylcarbamoyltransferase complex ATPase subunit type 1 TsaE [Salinisphaera aquimarina]|uniref:tRNA threonylcarbamoyladenosine biosynthesis protein TsaE n=1 Tax=Salinisphaera aquimarina TaxID=2094031 RepID=A0ABV7EUJ9_9GAMM
MAVMRLVDAAATDALGAMVARALIGHDGGLVVSLVGELGAGKTALARATLRGLGHQGAVVSPSYTLVEPYPIGGRTFHHLDLYRLGDPEELEFLGVRDIDTAHDWLFVEWAERGAGFLPPVDMVIELTYAKTGRDAQIRPLTGLGARFFEGLKNTT